MEKIFLIIFLMAFATTVFGAEVDQFSGHDLPIEDSADMINLRAQFYLEKALVDVNSKKEESCDTGFKVEKQLYVELSKYFSNHSKGLIIKDMLYNNEFPMVVIPAEESIYQNWTWVSGIALKWRFLINKQFTIYPEVRIGDVRVGIDKFEHLFRMGRIHFYEYYFLGHTLSSILNRDTFIEKYALGGSFWCDGVMSYGDISANLNGIRFWNHILQRRDDLLGVKYNVGPYVLCQNDQWIANPDIQIDFRNYIDESMDETVNCSTFATRWGLLNFKQSLKSLGIIQNLNDSGCPLVPKSLELMNKKYNIVVNTNKKKRTIKDWILNNLGSRVRE